MSESNVNDEGPGVSLWVSIAYSMPLLSVAMLIGPLSLVQAIYAKYFGLSLATVATVLLISRLFDAISDPVIGVLSDRCFQRFGTRKPFVLAGGLLMLLCSYFLFIPQGDVDGIYLLSWIVLFYLAWTLFEVPHLSWGSELSSSSMATNRIFSLRHAALVMGSMAFACIPLLPIFATTEFTPETLKWITAIATITVIPFLIVCFKFVPDGKRSTNEQHKSEGAVRMYLQCIGQNRPFLIFLGAYFFSGAGFGMWGALFYFYIDYFGMIDTLPYMFLLGLGSGLVGISFWLYLSRTVSKKLVWVSSLLLQVFGIFSFSVLSPDLVSERVVFILVTMIYIGSVGMAVMAPSILSDITDYASWKFNVENTATYFSVKTLVTKANAAIGGALGLALAGFYGFDPTGTTYTESGILGLRLSGAILPSMLVAMAIVFVFCIPLSQRKHAIVVKALSRRMHLQCEAPL